MGGVGAATALLGALRVSGAGGPASSSGTSAAVTPLEAARIGAILEDAIEKMTFLSAVTPDILHRRDEVADMTSGEIARLLAEQRALEARFEELVTQRAALKGIGNKARYKDLQTEFDNVSYQLKESMKTLCRNLKEHPDLSETVSRITEEREALVQLLERTLSALREGHYAPLVDFVEKERDVRDKLRAVASKEEEVLKEVDTLTTLLKEEEDKHAADMEARRLELGDLKEKLRKLKVDTTLTLRYARKEASARTEAAVRGFTAEESDLQTQIDAMRRRIALEKTVHDEAMEAMRRGELISLPSLLCAATSARPFHLHPSLCVSPHTACCVAVAAEQDDFARSAEEWKAKQAAELESKAAELAALTAERDRQRAQLEAFQARYDRDLAELAEREAAEAARAAAEEYAASEDARKHAAASSLQSVLGDMFAVVAAAAAASKAAKAAKGGDKKKKK